MELLPFRSYFFAHRSVETAFIGENHLPDAIQIAFNINKINEFEQHLRLVEFFVVLKLLLIRFS